jgi:GxxExxY protein
VHADIRRLEENEFKAVVYEVMGRVFEIRKEFGGFFDENIYHREITRRCRGAIKVPIEVCFADFRKYFFIDMLVAQGAVFELTAVESLNDRHRSQLLQYLMLADLPRGKLVNFKPESVEHKFVSTKYRHADRIQFVIDDSEWDSMELGARHLRDAVTAVLHDLGTGLEIALYDEIAAHILGGEQSVLQNIEIFSDGGTLLDSHPVRLTAAGMSYKITAVPERDRARTESHLRRFLSHTQLRGTHWINVRHNRVTFKTIHRDS